MRDEFDGFSVHLAKDEDDDDFLAYFIEMPEVSAFGETPERALAELKTAWEGVKESYRKHGERVPVFKKKRKEEKKDDT